MRRVFCALVVLALASPAFAADLELPPPSLPLPPPPDTVGPATFTRWSGFYGGGQVGGSNGSADFSGATQALIAFVLRETTLENVVKPSQWPVLGAADQSVVSFGAFAGYNTQWQDLIIGMEANFNRASFSLHAPQAPIARTTSDNAGSLYTVNLSGSASLVAADFATVRVRAGWVFGNFLPYAFVGPAFGVGSSSVSATVSGVQYTSGLLNSCTATAPCIPFSYTNSSTSNNAVLYGFTAGGGLDYAVTANIFLRAEFEWDQFKPPPGYFARLTTGRLGAGFKF